MTTLVIICTVIVITIISVAIARAIVAIAGWLTDRIIK